jgi:hypothetical protein
MHSNHEKISVWDSKGKDVRRGSRKRYTTEISFGVNWWCMSIPTFPLWHRESLGPNLEHPMNMGELGTHLELKLEANPQVFILIHIKLLFK